MTVLQFRIGQCIIPGIHLIEKLQFMRMTEESDSRLRPYHVEYTSSRPITEVKQRRARLVLGWVTAWEYRVS